MTIKQVRVPIYLTYQSGAGVIIRDIIRPALVLAGAVECTIVGAKLPNSDGARRNDSNCRPMPFVGVIGREIRGVVEGDGERSAEDLRDGSGAATWSVPG